MPASLRNRAVLRWIDEPMPGNLAVLVARDEVRRQREIVHEKGLDLEAVDHRPADLQRPRRPCGERERPIDAGFLERFLHHGFLDRCAGRNAAADQVVEQAWIDGLACTAAREP